MGSAPKNNISPFIDGGGGEGVGGGGVGGHDYNTYHIKSHNSLYVQDSAVSQGMIHAPVNPVNRNKKHFRSRYPQQILSTLSSSVYTKCLDKTKYLSVKV